MSILNRQSTLVSIIIPLYNCEKYIGDCILSCVKQTYKNIEIIVVNDGSTDNSQIVVKNLQSNFSNIKLLNKKNGGVSTALNLGIKNMSGKYFTWLSSDDIFYKDNIETKMKEFERFGSLKIVYSNYSTINQKGKLIRRRELSRKFSNIEDPFCMFLLRGISGCSMVIDKELFDSCGLFDKSMKTTQDYMQWYRFIKATKKCEWRYLNEPLIKTRLHDEQTTNSLSDIVKLNDDFWVYIINDIVSNKLHERLFCSIPQFANELMPLFMHNSRHNEVYKTLYNLQSNNETTNVMPNYEFSEFVKHIKKSTIWFEIRKSGLVNILRKVWLKALSIL